MKWIGRNGASLVLVIEVLAAGCGGAAEGAGNEQMTGATGSRADGTEAARRAQLDAVPFAVDQCDALGLKYDPTLSADACPPVTCGCSQFVSLPAAGPRGCVVDIDCAVACAQPYGGPWFSCAISGCADADGCPSPGDACLVPPGYDHGLCAARGYLCAQDRDCDVGSSCVVLDQDGSRRCTAPQSGSPCNEDADCGGRVCALPVDGFVGACSDGQRGERCFTDRDCKANLYCGAGVCADGSYESGCNHDAQCDSRACRWSMCVEGRDDDYCETDDDCASGVCVYGIRCSSGEVGANCEEDRDCKSGLCAANASDAACTAGELGSKCLDDADCRAGSCIHDAERRPGDHFGVCESR